MESIDREALVRRHNPEFRDRHPDSPLSVGNGDFAFTADFTGLQTFVRSAPASVPLCTMSQHGFHRYPDAPADADDLKLREYRSGGRMVGYMTDPRGQEELFEGLRINPHRFHQGRIGLFFRDATAGPAGCPDDALPDSRITDILQRLDLWTGGLSSRFDLDGQPVRVRTACHPDRPVLAVRMESSLLASGDIGLELSFPYASHGISGADWESPDRHRTRLAGPIGTGGRTFRFEREMDDVRYPVHLQFAPGTVPAVRSAGPHHTRFTVPVPAMEFVVLFGNPGDRLPLPSFDETLSASADRWHRYWTQGAAISFSGSRDLRARELERRVVLSQYLLAIQSLGSLPPAETGLTCNSWFGKFHLEMHPWQSLHALLWSRADRLEAGLEWFRDILPSARKRAAGQGYRGVRWPKMTDPSGRDSPSSIGCLLCWQQPHIILFAELLYRLRPTRALLRRYADRVFDTAEFMADYPQRDETRERYVLGPPVIPAQENHPPEETLNPLFELEYWRWGLTTAISWKERLGEAVPGEWTDVLAGLSDPPVDPQHPQCYAAHERCPDTYGVFGTDHPSMLLAGGFLPPRSVNKEMMSASWDAVAALWKWDTMWGWDFPAMAMTLARLGRRTDAVDVLLMDSPKNTYAPNGHNRQEGDDALPLYLPGNGALLLAVAMMAAGWDGSDGDCPGFPDDGSWTVRHEGLAPYI